MAAQTRQDMAAILYCCLQAQPSGSSYPHLLQLHCHLTPPFTIITTATFRLHCVFLLASPSLSFIVTVIFLGAFVSIFHLHCHHPLAPSSPPAVPSIFSQSITTTITTFCLHCYLPWSIIVTSFFSHHLNHLPYHRLAALPLSCPSSFLAAPLNDLIPRCPPKRPLLLSCTVSHCHLSYVILIINPRLFSFFLLHSTSFTIHQFSVTPFLSCFFIHPFIHYSSPFSNLLSVIYIPSFSTRHPSLTPFSVMFFYSSLYSLLNFLF